MQTRVNLDNEVLQNFHKELGSNEIVRLICVTSFDPQQVVLLQNFGIAQQSGAYRLARLAMGSRTLLVFDKGGY